MKQSDVRLLPHQSQTLDNSQLSAVMEDVMSETVFYKLLFDKNIWFVVSQNVRLIKCSAGMACSLISLRATDTTMERGDFFCPILIILQTNYSQIQIVYSQNWVSQGPEMH